MPGVGARSVLRVAAVAALGLGLLTTAQAQSQVPQPATDAAANPPAAMSTAGPGTGTGMDAAFDRADTNKDGKLDRKEAENLPAIAERFEKLDVDGDGFVSRDEFSKAGGS